MAHRDKSYSSIRDPSGVPCNKDHSMSEFIFGPLTMEAPIEEAMLFSI